MGDDGHDGATHSEEKWCDVLTASDSTPHRLGHDRHGNGGRKGRMTIRYHFSQPGEDVTLFTRTMTIEACRDAPLPDRFFLMVNPANIDAYHAAVARELG